MSEIASLPDIIILAVKPQQLSEICEHGFRPTASQLVVSVLAGTSTSSLRKYMQDARIVRTMPNVAASIGQSCTLILSAQCAETDVLLVRALFDELGTSEVLTDEPQMHAGTALASCGLAYFFVAMDAMADAGVAAGLPRKTAIRLAAGAIAGAGKMALAPHAPHPSVLRDSVTSPGGVTIQAVRTLEAKGFRTALLEAVLAATAKSEEFAKST